MLEPRSAKRDERFGEPPWDFQAPNDLEGVVPSDRREVRKGASLDWAADRQIAADLELIGELRRARQEFQQEICSASQDNNEELLELLRSDAMYEFSEFFYLLKARGIETADDIKILAEAHNAYLAELTSDDSKMRRIGLKRDRLLLAIFTSDTLPRLIQNWRDQPGAIDQSNLGRLLVTIMSVETTRKLVVGASRAGFLHRDKTPYGTFVVRSTGKMEDVYGRVMRGLRINLTKLKET